MTNGESFFTNDKEIFLMSLWLAERVTNDVSGRFSVTALSTWVPEQSTAEKDLQQMTEILGYTMSFVLERISKDIERLHGWDDTTNELYLSYMMALGIAFDKILGLQESEADKSLCYNLFSAYTDFGSDIDEELEYEEFWDFDSNEEGDDEIEEQYNAERFYTYRMSRMFDVDDREKLMNSVKSYSSVAISYYDDAFLRLPLTHIEEDITGN